MKPQELTKEQAYEACAEMWNIIAENGYEYKEQALCDYTYKIDFPENKCFACEVNKANCPKCPFWQYSEKVGNIIFHGCMIDTSPYSLWLKTYSKQYAIEIAQLFIDTLNSGE